MDTAHAPPTPPAELGCQMPEPVLREDGTPDWHLTRAKVQAAFQGVPDDPVTGAAAWTEAYNALWEREQEKRLLARMAEIDARIPELPGTAVVDWTPGAVGAGAYVVDGDAAQRTPCTRIDLGNGGFLVYAEGLIGALTDSQIATFCGAGFDDVTPALAVQQRLIALADAAPVCALQAREAPPDKLLESYFGCIGHQIRARGVTP